MNWKGIFQWAKIQIFKILQEGFRGGIMFHVEQFMEMVYSKE